MLLDAVCSVLGLVASWYLIPDDVDKVIILIGILQTPVLAYINGVAREDAALKSNGNYQGRS